MNFFFTKDAEKQFFMLDKHVQGLIRKKIEKIKVSGGTFKVLVDMEPATHRLRVGDWRLILKICEGGFDVLKVGHRSNIYKQ